MIFDKIENASLYASLSPYIAKAFSILRDPALIHQPDGKYVIEENRMWYMVQRYEPNPPNPANSSLTTSSPTFISW